MPENYIGIMCGTSLDSLDFSLCCFEKVKKLKTFKSYRISQKLRAVSYTHLTLPTTPYV